MTDNTFVSELMPRALAAAMMVLRETAVLATEVSKDFDGSPARQGEYVDVPYAGAATVGDVTPAAAPTAGTENTVRVKTVSLAHWKKASFKLTNREIVKLRENANLVPPLCIAEAVRALVNDLNDKLFATYTKIYGYAGTAGTNPFTTNVNPVVDLRTALNGQLAPEGNRRLIIGDAEDAAALKLAEFKGMQVVNSQTGSINATDNRAFRSAELGSLYGFNIRRDSNRPTHTAGTGAGILNKSSVAVGASSFVLKGEGASGTMVAGDIITFAGHDQTYAVQTAVADVSTADTVVAVKPNFVSTVEADEAVTLKATHKVNIGGDMRGFALAIRVPPNEVGGVPILGTHSIMTDPLTGIPLKLSAYQMYQMVTWELSILYGVDIVDERLLARLAG